MSLANDCVLLVGEVLIDYTLTSEKNNKLRHGGIIHSARAAWALGKEYSVAFYSPLYLKTSIEKYLKHHGCKNTFFLGEVTGSPNVMVIGDKKEIGDQQYDFLLKDEKAIIDNEVGFEDLSKEIFNKALIIQGEFETTKVIKHLHKNTKLYLDPASYKFSATNLNQLNLSKHLHTLFVSTSTSLFKDLWVGDIQTFVETASISNIPKIILKENRGGSRSYDRGMRSITQSPCYEADIIHSIGVGDVYDTTYMLMDCENKSERYKMNLSSLVASEYASTTYVDDFKKRVTTWTQIASSEIEEMKGNIVQWEKRPRFKIYLAAPDFSHVDTRKLDFLEKALKYHNFTPLRPIKINGEVNSSTSTSDKRRIAEKDIQLINESKLLIACLLNNDPGTVAEIGYAYAKDIPVLIYDPYNLAQNMFLIHLTKEVRIAPDKILDDVYRIFSLKNTDI